MKEHDKKTIQTNRDAEYTQLVTERYLSRQNTIGQLRRKHIALDSWSYVFNVGSVLTATYFVWSITSQYPIGWQIGFASFLIVLLGLNEMAKRYCINEGAEENRVWFAPVVLLVAVSFYASYEGGNRFTVEKAVGPAVERNEEIDRINEEIATIQKSIEAQEKTTWKGKITSKANQNIEKLASQKEALLTQRIDLENRDISRNDNTEQEHNAEIRSYGVIFGVVAGFMDICLIVCLLIARNAEKAARLLLGLVDADNNAHTPKTKRRKDHIPAAPKMVPASATESKKKDAPDLERIRYAQRVSAQLGELKQRLNDLEKSTSPTRTHARTHAHTDADARTPTHARTRTRKRTHARSGKKVPYGTCKGCGKQFKPTSKKNKYCNSECRKSNQKKK